MKSFKKFVSSIVLLSILLFAYEAKSASMAFGYLANNSTDANFDYLETIFANSFANSIKNIFDVKVLKPYKIDRILKNYKIKLKKNYKLYELPELIEKIGSDFFIYGNFTPLPNDRIKIILHFYANGSNRIFTFSNVGKMETEIFKLVDRITQILINFMDDENLYKSKAIPLKSNIALLTNISGTELNKIYYKFFKKGYKISMMQGNSLGITGDDKINSKINDFNKEIIKSFQYIYTKENSYDIITNRNEIKILRGTWAGPAYNKKITYVKKIYTIYDFDYNNTKRKILNKLNNTYKGTIDYLMIIGIDSNTAWVRCIDIKKKDLIWMQSNINGSNDEIIDKILKRMNTEIKTSFAK